MGAEQDQLFEARPRAVTRAIRITRSRARSAEGRAARHDLVWRLAAVIRNSGQGYGHIPFRGWSRDRGPIRSGWNWSLHVGVGYLRDRHAGIEYIRSPFEA